MSRFYSFLALAAALLGAATPRAQLAAQSPAARVGLDPSAMHLQSLVASLTVTPRVLVVGMHPDDEPSELIAWLSRGRHVETAYLSITRGEAGLNVDGLETGSALGAIRVQEALNARRVDGAHQFFTRAYDFGAARNVDDVFRTWNRDSVVGDVVTVIRAFRPHVVISAFPDSVTDGNAQHAALAIILDHAFTSSADPRRFPPRAFGVPWPVAKRYRRGAGIAIETAEFDRMLGMTYADIALEARAQQRTQGLAEVPHLPPTRIELERAASRVNADAPDRSLFDTVDTSIVRLFAGASARDSVLIMRFTTLADSARRSLDVAHPDSVVPLLAQAVRAANDLRLGAVRCRHPALDARPALDSLQSRCDVRALDFDASIDLMRRRANEALLAAAGVVIEATADRELVAGGDTANVMIAVSNRGTQPFAVFSFELSGLVGAPFPAPGRAVTLAPDSTVRFFARVAHLEPPRPWWLNSRTAERFDDTTTIAFDGLSRGAVPPTFVIAGIAVPEDIRRTSDVSVMLDVSGATVAMSLGPVIYRYADANVGLQNRQLAGIPDVAFRFSRTLSWVPTNKPFSRVLRASVKSFTDKPALLGIGKLAPQGVRVDSIPKEISLEPREQRDFLVPIHGLLTAPKRLPFAVWGATADGATFQQGFQTIDRSYIPPIRIFRTPGVWLQGVDVNVPPNLTVLYVPEGVDDVRSALTEIGVFSREVSPEALLTADLSHVSTIVIAAHALERYPDLAAQAGRLMTFVRNGGTLVVQRGGTLTSTSRVIPFRISVPRYPDRVDRPDAPVTVLDAASRVLSWPNKITAADWDNWVSGRAESLPADADARYTKVIGIHDPDQPENRNALLVARVGKGTLVYTALTLDEQIAGGVSGALRLMVNLISAGLPR